MVSIDLLVVEIEFGLFLVEENPELTFIMFIAFSIMLALGLRFGYYAHRNLKESQIETQDSLWLYLRYIGMAATLYATAGILDIVTSLDLAVKNGFLLGTTLLLAFAIRQIHYTANAGEHGSSSPFEQFARALFVGLVFIYIVVVLVTGHSRIAATIEGVSALAFLTYGGAYYYDQASDARLQGTLLDSLLRHLLPVLAFSALVGILALWVSLGLARVIVLHVQVVFIIMAATSLMTGTVKLRQNLAGL